MDLVSRGSMDLTRLCSFVFSISAGVITAAATLNSGTAAADPSRSVASMNAFGAQDNQGFTDVPTPYSQRDILFRSLLTATGKDLTYPNFPRTWVEESSSGYVASNTAIGLTLPVATGGISIDNKNVFKSTLVIIAANSPDNEAPSENGVTVDALQPSLKFNIFNFDPV